MNRSQYTLLSASIVVLASGLAGCRDHMPHSFTLAPGDVARMHAKPAEGGYYTNWDPYAATLELTPARAVNPVRTQHVLIATVKDKDGRPLPNRRVEWIVTEGSVGSIVEVDESGWRASRGHKLSNTLAVTHTNNYDHVLTRGNDDPSDDIQLTKGQTWCVVTSATEGATHVVAYAPGIYDWKKHKVFATKLWLDVAWQLPPPATNRIGTSHVMKTKVTQHSDGAPLSGYEVQYKIVSGPAATLQPGGGQVATAITDKNGIATMTLAQAAPKAGTNEIHISITRPENKQCCTPAQLIHVGKTTKTWLAPSIAIKKTAPARAVVGQKFQYAIAVGNPSQVAANNVVVTDVLPDGIQYVSSNPAATVAGQKLSWSLGTLAPGGKKGLSVTVQATKTGKFNNCANVTANDGLKGESCAETVITKPSLALKKEAPAEVILCDQIAYVLTVSNPGDAPAQNVKITDNLPAGIKAVDGRQNVTIDVGTLAPKQAKAFKLMAKASKTGTYTNTATASGDGGLTAKASAKTIVRVPVLVLTKTGPKTRFAGRPLQYTLTVANKGDADARNTVLTDTLPTGAQLTAASNGGQAAGGKVTWNLGTLKPGDTKTVTLSLRPTVQGQIRNTATATAYCAQAAGEATTMIKGIPAILLECVDIADPVEVGAQETYVITVTNQGSAVGTNITVECTVPAEQSYVSSSGATKGTAAGAVVKFAPLGSLAPKAKAVWRVVTKGVKAGDSRFKVSLTSDQMTSPATETESTHVYSD